MTTSGTVLVLWFLAGALLGAIWQWYADRKHYLTIITNILMEQIEIEKKRIKQYTGDDNKDD